MSTVIYLANQNVQIIEGTGNGKNISVKNYISVEAPEGSIINGIIMDTDAFVDFLKETWAANKLSAKDVTLIINSKKFIGRKLELPPLNEKKTFDYIAREYAGMGREEEQVYSYIPISKTENKMLNVYVEGIEPDFIRDYIDIFNAAGLKLTKVYSDESSLITFCSKTAAKYNKTFVLLVADAMTLTTLLWVNGSFYYYNSTRCFHEVDTEEYAGDIARSISQLSQFMKANQIEYQLESIQIAGVNPDNKVMYVAAINELDLGASVDMFKFASGGGAVIDPNLQQYLHAVAGLYENGKAENFLTQIQKNKKKISKEEEAHRQEVIGLLTPVIVALTVMVVLVVVLAAVKRDKAKQLAVLEEYNGNPEVMFSVSLFDSVATRNAFLTAQFNAIDDVEANVDTYPCGNSEIVSTIQECAVGYADVKISSFNAEVGTIEMIATASNVEDINKFIKKLTECDTFSNVNYTGYNYAEELDKWNIMVTCTLAESSGR